MFLARGVDHCWPELDEEHSWFSGLQSFSFLVLSWRKPPDCLAHALNTMSMRIVLHQNFEVLEETCCDIQANENKMFLMRSCR